MTTESAQSAKAAPECGSIPEGAIVHEVTGTMTQAEMWDWVERESKKRGWVEHPGIEVADA